MKLAELLILSLVKGTTVHVVIMNKIHQNGSSVFPCHNYENDIVACQGDGVSSKTSLLDILK